MIRTLYQTSDGRSFNTLARAELHEKADFDTWLKGCGYDKFLAELDDCDKASYYFSDRGISDYVLRLIFERDSDR
jgi:hypothetical protein